MSNRFHNKFHRHNHHTRATDRGRLYPDSAYDPIASEESPFQGEFYLDGDLFALSSVTVGDKIYAPLAEFGNVTITNNLNVLGEYTTLDTYVFCSSAVEITNSGTTPALTVTQKGNAAIAKFVDLDENKSIIFDSIGQVGIGTLVPTSLLHVRQMDPAKNADVLIEGAYASSKLLLKSPLSGQIDFTTPDNTYANIIGNVSLSSLAFATIGAERINILSNGNVGIANNNPSVKLDVAGNTRITANNSTTDVGALTIVKPTSAFATNDVFIYTYGDRLVNYNPQQDNVGGGLKIRTAGGTYNTPTATLSGRVGYIAAASTHNGVDWKNSSTIILGIESNATLNNHNSYIAFETLSGSYSDNRTERMRINSSGSVGIGTLTPEAKLEVNGSILSKNASQYSGFVVKNAANTVGYINGTSAINDDGALGLLSNGVDNVAILANGNSYFNGGNVGIGTITPAGNLHIKNSKTTGTTEDTSLVLVESVNQYGITRLKGLSGGQVQLTDSNEYTYASIIGYSQLSSISFATNGFNQRMFINSIGNVGIGTTNPNTNLTVVGDISAQGSLNELYSSSSDTVIKSKSSFGNAKLQLDNANGSTGTGPLIDFQTNSNTFATIRGNTSLSAIVFETNSTERLRINELGLDITGNVTVHGDLSSTGNQYFANTYFTTTSAISVVNISPVSETPALYIAQSGPGDIASFYDLDQGVEVLHVGGSNGTFPNVGIKMSNPGKDFTVNGEISAKSTIWDATGNSVLWNSVYEAVRSLSATWLGTGQLVSNTVGVSASSTFVLSQSSTDIEILTPSTAVTLITAFSNGVKGVTYTLTNKTNTRITIQSSPSIIIRRGNTWRSNTTSLSGAFLVLPLSGSCSVRADENFVSVW